MGKTVVFDGKMGMRKFGSTAPPFGKVACAVKGMQFFCCILLQNSFFREREEP